MCHPAFLDRSNEELCRLAGGGDSRAEEELVARHVQMVRACARPLFLAGCDSEDLIQEGMLGLLTAIRTFDETKRTAFRTYAEVCVRNRLRTAVRSAQGGKHIPLNLSISFEPPLFDEVCEPTFSGGESPEDVIIGREELRELLDTLKERLTPLERQIFSPYLKGLSCGEIARQVDRPQKSVDNAIQRIRRKMVRQLRSGVISRS